MTDLDPNICEQCGETEATDGEQLCERCQEVHELYARVETLRLRAEKAEAELARVNAEAAVMREVLHFIQEPMPKPYCGYCDDCDAAVAATRDALSSTSAGAGLLKRLEAADREHEIHMEMLRCKHGLDTEERCDDCASFVPNGLLKRLEASEAVCEAAEKYVAEWRPGAVSHGRALTDAVEAWKRARGHEPQR